MATNLFEDFDPLAQAMETKTVWTQGRRLQWNLDLNSPKTLR
jgi:hypothetical protein